MLNDVAVLNEDSSDLRKVTSGGTISSVELGYDGEFLGGVHLEVWTWTEEVLDTDSEWVEVTTVLVTDTIESLVTGTAVSWVLASVLAISLAWMGGESRGDLVGLPDIHLGAAGSPLTLPGIWIRWRWVPSENISLTINILDILWALSITVSSSVSGTSLVLWVLARASIGVHLNEVEGTVETAWHVGHIDVESELLILELEHFISILTVHHVGSRTDVLSVLALSDEAEGEL